MRRILLAAAILPVLAFAPPAAAKGFFISSSDKGEGVFVFQSSDDDGGKILIRTKKAEFQTEWKGEFDIAPDGRSLARLDGRMSVESKKGPHSRRVEYTGRKGGIEEAYFVDGERKTIDAATRKEIGEMMLSFVRISGIDADERVESILKSGGVNAVLAEIGEIPESHAAMRYMISLAEQAPLKPAHIENLSARIADLDGDHDKRRAIEALFEHQSLSAASREMLLKSADRMTSDHELRLLVEAASAGEMTEGAAETAFALLKRISSDHDFRLGAEALLDNKAFADRDAASLLALAGDHIDSDHELRLIVETASGRIGRSEAVAVSALTAISSIKSSHEKRLAIEEVADALPRRSRHWEALIAAAGAIGSDHEAGNALETIADAMPREPGLLAAYRQAVAKIDSQREREQALEAIGAN